MPQCMYCKAESDINNFLVTSSQGNKTYECMKGSSCYQGRQDHERNKMNQILKNLCNNSDLLIKMEEENRDPNTLDLVDLSTLRDGKYYFYHPESEKIYTAEIYMSYTELYEEPSNSDLYTYYASEIEDCKKNNKAPSESLMKLLRSQDSSLFNDFED